MSSEGTSDMLSPCQKPTLDMLNKHGKSMFYTPQNMPFFDFSFEIFKSSVLFKHILETYSRYA